MNPTPAPRRAPAPTRAPARSRHAGFTLIELMVAVAVVGILAAIALPSYAHYMMRSRSLAALTNLSSTAIALEQRFQDVGSYGGSGDACAVSMVQTTSDFVFSCAIGTPINPVGFTVTAVGSGLLAGITYSIDDAGVRRTLAHPYGVPLSDCWTIRGTTCDS